jgi:hypothetical protein
MADNVISNAGSGGPTWATDEIGSVHYPRMKIVHGADGSATDTSTAAPLPVVVPGSVAVTGTFYQATQPVSFAWAGLTDAQLRATAVAVSAASLPLPTGAATAANQTTANSSLSSIDTKLPAAVTPGLLPVDTLASVGVARQLAAGATSANTALTTTCRRISICAQTANIRFAIGTGAQTASGTSHFIQSGERLDLDVPANAQIAVIRAGSTDGTLELSELV